MPRSDDPPDPRRPYHVPALEPLGAWSARTLQQSIPIGPGSLIEWPGVERDPPSDLGRDFLDRILPGAGGMP